MFLVCSIMHILYVGSNEVLSKDLCTCQDYAAVENIWKKNSFSRTFSTTQHAKMTT